MTRPKKPVTLISRLEKSIISALDEIEKGGEEYTLTDKKKIWDSAIKLEELKNGIQPDDDGKGFED